MYQGLLYLYHPPKSIPEKKNLCSFINSKFWSIFSKPKSGKIYSIFERIYTNENEPCCYFSDKKSDTTIIFFHGNGSNAKNTTFGIYRIQSILNVNIVLIEYPGYGERGGAPSKCIILNDLENTWKLLKPKIEKTNIFFYGSSLGAAVALHTNCYNLKGIILQNPFLNIYEMSSVIIKKYIEPKFGVKISSWLHWGFKWVCTENWNNEIKIKNLKVPCLFICGLKDKIIPFKQKELLYKICKSNCELITYNGGHNNWSYDEHILNKIKKFIS